LYILKDCISYGYIPELIDIIYLSSILFGILTIINKNPIISVLFLIGLFMNISSLLIIIGFTFIGLSYILVYVGAVSILFLFILMLINIRISELSDETNNDIPLAILIVMLFFYIIRQILPSNIIYLNQFNYLNNNNIELIDDCVTTEQIVQASSKSWDTNLVDITHITGIGNILYTNYAIWLVITSIILLLGMVGSIVITIKQK
jgi:NADH-ubiquinone oxidoreductase chain 6